MENIAVLIPMSPQFAGAAVIRISSSAAFLHATKLVVLRIGLLLHQCLSRLWVIPRNRMLCGYRWSRWAVLHSGYLYLRLCVGLFLRSLWVFSLKAFVESLLGCSNALLDTCPEPAGLKFYER